MTAAQRWEEKWLPRVDAEFDRLIQFDPSSVAAGGWEETIELQTQRFGKIFAGVHVQCVIPSDAVASAFIDAYIAKFGAQHHSDALALMQGFSNKTLERAAELWELSRLVRTDESLAARLAAPGINPTDSSFGEFATSFAAFLDRWGETMDMFVQDLPSWRENPRVPLNLIFQNAKQTDAESPIIAQEAKMERRLALEAKLRARPSDVEISALLDRLSEAQEMLPVRENHNFLCDQRLSAASRARWLNLGRLLTKRNSLESAEMVFYLTPTELIETLEGAEGPNANEIHERRLLQQAVRETPPPAVLGKPQDEPERSPDRPIQLAGVAASPGRFTGRARIIRSIEEAVTLEADEILVCVVTAPAWTPIFAQVGAVVTDAGNMLSHPSIIARENGLPAVVGTKTATENIPDGAMVTVDGDSGTVTVEAS
jgi:pyruvate,water dikinase